MTRTVCGVAAALASIGVIVLLHPPLRLAAQTDGVTSLLPGTTIERQLARGDEHRFALTLASGEHVNILVDQRSVDLIVQTRSPDGATMADFQDDVRTRGAEQVDLVADKRGTYFVVVRPAPGTTTPGMYAIRIVARHPSNAADRAMQEARTLATIAARLERDGRFTDARALLERAQKITEATRGPDDIQLATLGTQLARVYRKVPDGPKAEATYQRAIAIFDRRLGPDHPTTAVARSQLAAFYERGGERRKAEPLLRQAMDVIERTLGTEHRWYVSCLATLGNLRDGTGDLDGEEEIVQRALAIAERIGETDTLLYATLLNNLGEVYRQKQEYTRAEELLRRSVALSEQLLGPDNYSIATALQNLGIIARERKEYATAIAYNTRALTIRERVVGPDHPDIAHILTNLANIYRSMGDYPRSLTTHLRALHIWETATGAYQPATLLSVGNIAKIYAAQGDFANAIAYQRRADDIVEKQLTLNLAVGSEREKLAFARNVSERTDRTISLHLREASANPDAAALATLVVLQRKGRVLDAMADALGFLHAASANERDHSLMDRLRDTTAQLAKLALNPPDGVQREARQAAIRDLERKKDRIEAELSDRSDEFRARAQPVTLEAVQAAMPDNAALLEFAIFRPFDPKAERNAEAYGPPHYAAYVVRKYAAPLGIDLGPAAAIGKSIAELRQAFRNPLRTDYKRPAREVDEAVMRPLRNLVGDASRLLISPDGDLNHVPFEALVDEQGRYLIERYAMSYLTSGRDLLRLDVKRDHRSETVVVADPLFGEPATGTPVARIPKLLPIRALALPVPSTTDLPTVYFAPLAASAEEARAIKALFPEATLLTGARATKAMLQRVDAPRILHIASHGFFLQDPPASTPGSTGSENPLLRSGLALAGANLAYPAREDGILTALEAASLNLWGTKLVTLSACDTGIGEVRNGEGVYGLRRAFVLAGTETLVMSLWPVSDSIARETMVAYYTGLRAGLGRGDALRQAKLAMLARQGRQHPYYWSSFIQSGEWASLDGRR